MQQLPIPRLFCLVGKQHFQKRKVQVFVLRAVALNVAGEWVLSGARRRGGGTPAPCVGEGPGVGAVLDGQTSGAPVPGVPGHVQGTESRSVNFSVPQFPHWQQDNNNSWPLQPWELLRRWNQLDSQRTSVVELTREVRRF